MPLNPFGSAPLPPSIGNTGKYLTNNGSIPSWSAAQLYEAIVATSGGDYTTVGAAINAGKTRIFVRNGTYVESAISLATNVTIVGESRDGAIIDLNSNSMTLSDNCTVSNVTFKRWASAGLRASGAANCRIVGCRFEATTANTCLRLGNFSRVNVSGCLFINDSATPTDTWIVDSTNFFTGLVHDNFFQGNYKQVMLITQGSLFRFSNNYCQSTYSLTTTQNFVDINQSILTSLHDCSIENNYFATDGAANNTVGIGVNNVQFISIRYNNISVSTAATAIKLTGSTNTLITGNYVIRASVGLSFNASSNNNQAVINDFSQATTDVSDLGTGNVSIYNGV